MDWTDPADSAAAAQICGTCPGATSCLLAAMRVDAAHRAGADPVGLTGVYAGVWFDPDHLPAPVHRAFHAPGRLQRRLRKHAA